MNLVTLIRIHASVLIACSFVGLFGFYSQYHYFQVTACIPATVGLCLLTITLMDIKNFRLKFGLLFLTTLVFGIILTRMSVKFIPQEFQPLRKRIYFPVMALSSIITVILMARYYSRYKKAANNRSE